MDFKLNRLTVYYPATYHICNVSHGKRMDIRGITGSSPILTTSLSVLHLSMYFGMHLSKTFSGFQMSISLCFTRLLPDGKSCKTERAVISRPTAQKNVLQQAITIDIKCVD